ncbi:MAG TPA: hypothetical protein VNM90_01930 [Haliangium sp.]|nr:hypothetical protein [Haliangium sp.]
MRVRLGVAVFLIFVAGAVAQAGKPRTVHGAFAGQIVISTSPLRPAGETEAEMIESIRAAHVQQITARDTDGEEASWSFYFTAFLDKQPRVSELALDVYAAEGDKRYITSKRMMGIDPRLQILGSDMTLTEEDGVKAGARYRMVLTGQVGNREVTFATAIVTMR